MLGMTINQTLTVQKTQNQIKTMMILKIKFTKEEMVGENEKILIQKESNFYWNIWDGRAGIYLQYIYKQLVS